MKIRDGFVSNSSSSSFIMRGIIRSTDEVCEVTGVKEWHELDYDERNTYHIETYGMRNPFSYRCDPEEACIVGRYLGSADDGEVYVLEDNFKDEDTKLLEDLRALGFTVQESDLKTCFQYLSNDNF